MCTPFIRTFQNLQEMKKIKKLKSERTNMAANKNKLQTVSVKIFKTWDFHQDFTIQDDGEKIINYLTM